MILMIFFQAMQGVFIIVIIVAIGYFLTAKGWFNKETSALLPKLINYVALPTFMLWNLTTTFDAGKLKAVLYGLAVPFISMSVCCLFGVLISKALKIPPHRRGVFRTVFFCSNSVFIGIPVNLALFGDISTPYVLLYFLVNTFLFWTAGNYFIGKDGTRSDVKLISWDSLKNIFSPPFWGFLFAIAVILTGIRLPEFIINTAKYLGGLTTPLSLIFIGVVIFGVRLKDVRFNKDVIAALLGRFVIAPSVVLLIAYLIPIPLLMKKVFVIQAALPAMTQITIVAGMYEADAGYAATLTAITTLASAVAIPFYMLIL
ncbi:MAG: AEC family transporter [Negativicutes bacterium]|nr:AEC family transporter [Negativicutes bacterium]